MPKHHAVLLLGSSLSETGFVCDEFRDSTELEFFTFESLPIANVRQLIERAYIKPLEKDTKTIVIETKSISVESQNALLKVLEEPPVSTKIILVVPSLQGLLPTLLSRLSLPEQNFSLDTPFPEYFNSFQQMTYANRLDAVAQITKNKETDKIEALRSGTELWCAANIKHKNTKTMLWAASLINVKGSSKKMLLEEIAFLLPL